MVLEKITQANDIKKVGKAEWSLLAEEIRAFLIDKIKLRCCGADNGAAPCI